MTWAIRWAHLAPESDKRSLKELLNPVDVDFRRLAAFAVSGERGRRAVQARRKLASRPSGDELFRGGLAEEQTPVQGGVAQATHFVLKAAPAAGKAKKESSRSGCEELETGGLKFTASRPGRKRKWC